MQLILCENVPSLGKAGELVKVRDGYGRNYLLPRKMAMLANEGNLKVFEAQKKMIEAGLIKVRKKAEEIASRFNSLELTLTRKVGKNDRLFGAVTKIDIAQALQKEGIQIDKHLILLEAPIKTIGTFDVPVKLHPEVSASFKLWVIRQAE